MRKRVVVLDDYQGVALELGDWSRLDEHVEVRSITRHIDDARTLLRELADAHVIVAMRERTALPTALLARLPNLQLVVTTGMRNAVVAPPPHIPLLGTRASPTPAAELTWALILAGARRLDLEMAKMRNGGWQSSVGRELAGSTLGIIGLGRIGSRVARIARAFDMHVLAWSDSLTLERAEEHGATAVDLLQLLDRADICTIHTQLSDRTRGLLGRDELDRIGSRGMLVNTSRAAIVDQPALMDALDAGTLGLAALDVYETEPLPADHRLRSSSRALLTPHLGFVTEQNYRTFFQDIVDDIAAWLDSRLIRVVER